MTQRLTSIFQEVMKRAGRKAADGACEVAYFDPRVVAAARKALDSAKAVEDAASGLRTIAHPSRLRLLVALEDRELCVCDCAQVLGGSISGTSQHLKELRRMGAITFRAEGKMAYYRIADARWLAIARAALVVCSSHELAVKRKASA